MKSLLLRLEGPLQAWGTESRFPYRDTQREPSKSGVIGLLGAALGMARDDQATLGRLGEGRLVVRVDREGEVLRDYHTAGGGTYRGQPHSVYGTKDPVITHRDYLSSASFLAAMEWQDDDWVDQVDRALLSPRWPLVLGRRACPPALPVRVGTVAVDAESAVRSAEYPSPIAPAAPLRLVIECASDEAGAEARQDQPLSFRMHHRSFARRWVRTAFLAPAEVVCAPLSAEGLSIVHQATRI